MAPTGTTSLDDAVRFLRALDPGRFGELTLESAATLTELNLHGARVAREAADEWTKKTPERPRFVAGSIGPLNRTLSISPDVNDPSFRAVSFDEVR